MEGKRSNNFIDLTGQIFGELTIIEIFGKDNSGKILWRCKCSCGNYRNVTTGGLRGISQIYYCEDCDKKRKKYVFADLTGQVFGNLTIIKLSSEKDYRRKWECLCSCGKTKILTESSLLKRGSNNCGCLRKRKGTEDLTGKVFGRLTVIDFDRLDENNKKYYWNCICSCGNNKVVCSGNLKRGHTKTCGKCSLGEGRLLNRAKEMIDKKFTNLLVLGIDHTEKVNNHNLIYINCKCDCGNEIIELFTDVERGRVKSCNCLKKFNRTKATGEASFNRLYSQYSRNAKVRGFEFELDEITFRKITKENCCYCGREPSQVLKLNSGDYIYNGIDRVDSLLGYIENNCVPCCGQCNKGKMEVHKDEFLQWIERVYNYSILNKIKSNK